MRKEDKDNDLENILEPLKTISPTDLQMQKWKSSVLLSQRNLSKYNFKPQVKKSLQFLAAGVVGFLIGAAVFGRTNLVVNHSEVVANISSNDATFQRQHDNLD